MHISKGQKEDSSENFSKDEKRKTPSGDKPSSESTEMEVNDLGPIPANCKGKTVPRLVRYLRTERVIERN